MTGNSTPAEKLRAVFLAALMIGSVFAAGMAFSGTVAATGNASVVATPDTPGSTTDHTVTGEVEPNDDSASFNDIEVDYSVGSFAANGGSLTNVDQADIQRLGIDTDGDDEIETDLSGQVTGTSLSNNDETLLVNLDGSYTLSQGNEVILEYGDVDNPTSTGSYSVDVAINTQSTDNPTTATLSINSQALTATNTGDTVGDDVDVVADTEIGEQVTIEHKVDGEVRNTVTVTDGGSGDEDGTQDGSVSVTLQAGKTAGGSSTVTLTDSDGDPPLSDTYTTTNYAVEITPSEVIQGSTSTVTGDIFEYPGDLQDDATLDYSLVYEENANDNTEDSNGQDIVVAESDTNSGEFTVQRTFDEVDDANGELHQNDYPSDAFDGDDPAYTFFVDSATDTDGPAAAGQYSKETPSAENNEGSATVETRLDVTAQPDESPIQYEDSVDVSGTVSNADGGLGSYAVKLETPTGVTAKTTDTAQTGEYTYTAVFNDAGEWTFGTDEGGFIEYENFTVQSADADVTIENSSGNIRNFPDSYKVEVDQPNGNNLDLDSSGDYEGYVSIIGEFGSTLGTTNNPPQVTTTAGDINGFSTSNSTTFVRAADLDGDGNIEQIHMLSNSDGYVEFDATPIGDEVTAELQNDLDGQITAGSPGDLENIVTGVENTNDAGDTPDAPDYEGAATDEVNNPEPVNILSPKVEDPQDTTVTSTGDTVPGAGYTNILNDAGPSIVEVLPLADDTASDSGGLNVERVVSGDRLGFDGNQNLDGITAYRASFQLRDGDNNEIAPGSNSGDFDYMIVEGAGINATVYQDGANSVAIDSRNGNLLDATYGTGNTGTADRLEFVFRPTETDDADELITHKVKVIDEDPVFLNLSAAGLNIDSFKVDDEEVTEVPASTTLNLTSTVEAPYDGDAPVNNGRVRLTQTGTSTEAETDARTSNVNDGEYEFENFQIADRGIDTGTDNIADQISELVFTAYQYNNTVNPSGQALTQDEVDRAAVESLAIAPNRSLQIGFDAENTSVYSGFSGPYNTFTLTRGVEYDQIAFNLTYGDGQTPVNLTRGVGGDKITGGLDALSGNTDFISIVGPTEDGQGPTSTYGVKFDTSASDPANGTYVISDITEGSSNVTSASGTGLNDGDSFTFPGNAGSPPGIDEGQDTYQLNITTPDANFKENPDTGYFNVKNPSADGEVVGVASNDINGVTYGDLSHDASDAGSFVNVSDIETETLGIDRVYRVNGTFTDALGTPINGSKLDNARLGFDTTWNGQSSDFSFVSSLGNSLAPDSNYGGSVEINNASGQFQYDIQVNSDADGDGFTKPVFWAWANNQSIANTATAYNNDYAAYITANPPAQNPVVEVYDENGGKLPEPTQDGTYAPPFILAKQPVTNDLRIEAFPADADDITLPDGQLYTMTGPSAETSVQTTTQNASGFSNTQLATDGYDNGQIGFLSITPTGTGEGIIQLRTGGPGGSITTDTASNDIVFNVQRSNRELNVSLSPATPVAGENVTFTATDGRTSDPVETVTIFVESPSGETTTLTTDADGEATLAASFLDESGEYTISTRRAGYGPASTSFSVAAAPEVNFEDQTTNGQTVTVDTVGVPEGGFVVIHNESLTTEGDAVGSVIGVSDYLAPGQYNDVQVTLDEPISENQTLIAMPHKDTDGDETYDFVTSGGSEDGPYTVGGSAVTDGASITVESQDQVTVPGASGPAQNTDGDSQLEDVNGDGQTGLFDALFYYNNRNSDEIKNNPAQFDFDGDGQAGTLFDALALYNEVSA